MRLQAKIFLVFLSVSLLLGGPVLWTVYETTRRVDLQEIAEKGVSKTEFLADLLANEFQGADETQLLPFLQTAQEQSGALYVAAIGLHGRVVAHTNVAEKGQIYRDRDTQQDLRLDKADHHLAHYRNTLVMEIAAPVWTPAVAESPAEDFLLSGGKDSRQKKRLGVVRLGLPLDHIIRRERRLLGRIAAILIVGGGLGIMLVFFLMRRLLRPVRWLSAGTARIAQGDYTVSVPVLSKDELGDLANDFNRMSCVLAQTTVSQEYLSSILEGLIEPLLIMEADTTIQQANHALLALLGYKKSEVVGKTVDVLVARPEGSPFGESEEGLRIRNGNVQNMELELATQAGQRVPVLYSSSLLRGSDQRVQGIIAVLKDMTERKKLESAVRRSEKMSAVGQLAAGVAHEINNPLGVILGFAQGVCRRLSANDPLELPLKSIEKEAVRCRDLVQDLLTFSRASKAEREPMDLNRAVEGARSLVTAQARIAQIEVRQELADHLPRILGNSNQIQQIIVNLANNAFDAMGGRAGTFTLQTGYVEERPLSWVLLRAIDTGPGIPPEVLPRIFDPFFTTKPVGKGTGLGLSLVHEIVKKHSGLIEVESAPGRTEFRIKFPARGAPEKPFLTERRQIS